VSIVERDAAGALSLKPLARFDSAPQAVGRSGPSGTLVATGLAVVRVAPDGTIRRVASIDTRDLYPQSIVEAANGSIFLGMRRYVVEVAPGTLSTRISCTPMRHAGVQARPTDVPACVGERTASGPAGRASRRR
jgi:hypothetical protein